jgi:hypothetical protein
MLILNSDIPSGDVKEIKDQSINSEDANLNGSTIMLYGPSE